MRSTTRRAGVAIIATAVLAGIPQQAQAKSARKSAAGSRTRTIQVHAHFTEPAGNIGVTCLLVTPDCRMRYAGTSTYTGTFWGHETNDLHSTDEGVVTPGGHLTYEGDAVLTGGIVGCGTGSFTFYGKGFIDMSRYDPITNSAPGYNDWHIRPGSGTGQLTNLVSGGGDGHWTYYSVGKNNDPNQSGEGDFTGTITCRL